MNLKVSSIFESVNGEGTITGIPATFLRLAGCSMGCKYCDTDFSENKKLRISPHSKGLEKLLSSIAKTEYLVITGGEPFEQLFDLDELLELFPDSLKINIQTNGIGNFTNVLDATRIYEFVKKYSTLYYSISPKFEKLINSDVATNIVYKDCLDIFHEPFSVNFELKFIGIEWLENYDLLVSLLSSFSNSYTPVYFQYCWNSKFDISVNQALNENFCRNYFETICELRKDGINAKFGTQVHKLLGIQ